MNAVCRWVEFIFPADFEYGKHCRKLKEVFHSLGGQRQLQLNNRYIKDCNLPGASQKIYAKFYAGQKEKIEHRCKKAIKKYDKDSVQKSGKKMDKLIGRLSNAGISSGVRRFMMEEGRTIRQLTEGYGKPAKIHQIRKHLKNLIYMNAFLGQRKEIKLLALRLKEIEKQIGDWHDKIILVAFINKLIKQNRGAKPAAIHPFYKMADRLCRESEAMLNQFKPNLENIIVTLGFI